MRIPSKDVPQADTLKDVIRLVDAVGRGATTYQDMAAAIQKVGRQGRYYRRAAEILGFVHRVDKNHAMLTTTGWAVVNSAGDDRRRLVKNAVLKSDVFRQVVSYLSDQPRGVSRADLRRFLEGIITPVGPSMMPRRVSTILDWLAEIGMLTEQNGLYLFRRSL
jgi:hypothetical protein